MIKQNKNDAFVLFSKLFISFIYLFIGIASPVMANPINNTDELINNKRALSYIHSRPLLQKMFELGRIQDRKFGLQINCSSGSNVEPIDLIILSPIEFPADKDNPIKGSWKSRYKLKRCDEVKTYNVIFMAKPNGDAPDATIFYPGTTEANMLLVKDTMPSAIAFALLRAGQRDCKDISVFDMKVTHPQHDVVDKGKVIKGIWKELWTIRICGKPIDVGITFTPNQDGPGTSFLVNDVSSP